MGESRVIISRNPWAEGNTIRMAVAVDGEQATFRDVRDDGSLTEGSMYRRVSQTGTAGLAGAWEYLSERRNGLLLQTDTHYTLIETNKDRPRPETPSTRLSDAEVAQLYTGLSVQAGTYTITGSTMTRVPFVALNPDLQGREFPVEFDLEGDILTRHLPRPDGTTTDAVWRRLG
jgi:hypothetical protein